MKALPDIFIGLSEKNILYFFVLFGILASYVLVKPLTLWIMSMQLKKLLNYIVGSLLFLLIYFAVALWCDEWKWIFIHQFKFTLQVVAFFGLGLSISYLIKGRKES